MTRHYCCYFDHRYLPRGLAMIRSLHRFEPDSIVWVLCLNDACHALLTVIAEPNVRLVALAEFEAGDSALQAARADRSLVEFYFTCTPSLVRYVQQRVPEGATVTYVDGDLFFFSDPRVLHEELGDGAVSLTPHRFPPALAERERYGIYNVGWLGFRNDERGRAVANWWRERCNEWCRDVLDGDRFADQKYLERFAELFSGVVVLRHEGANVAPWNVARYSIARRNDVLFVRGDVPLLFFHFHGLRSLGRFAYLPLHRPYGAPFRGVIHREVYRPYVAQLAAIEREVQRLGGAGAPALLRPSIGGAPTGSRLRAALQRVRQLVPALLRREVVLVVARRVI